MMTHPQALVDGTNNDGEPMKYLQWAASTSAHGAEVYSEYVLPTDREKKLFRKVGNPQDGRVKSIVEADALFCGSLAVGDLVDVNIGPRALEMQSLLWQHKTEALAETITCQQCRLKIEVEDLVTVTVAVPDGEMLGLSLVAATPWHQEVGGGAAIKSLDVGGIAESNGMIAVGQVIVDINDTCVTSMSLREVQKCISDAEMDGLTVKLSLLQAPAPRGCKHCSLCEACAEIHPCKHSNFADTRMDDYRFSLAQSKSYSMQQQKGGSGGSDDTDGSDDDDVDTVAAASVVGGNGGGDDDDAVDFWIPAVVIGVKNVTYEPYPRASATRHPELQLRLRPQECADPSRMLAVLSTLHSGVLSRRPYYKRSTSHGRRTNARGNRRSYTGYPGFDSDLSASSSEEDVEETGANLQAEGINGGGGGGNASGTGSSGSSSAGSGNDGSGNEKISSHAELTYWFNINKCVRRTPERKLPWVARLERGDDVAIKTTMHPVLVHEETGDRLPCQQMEFIHRYLENILSSAWVLAKVESIFPWLHSTNSAERDGEETREPQRFAMSASIEPDTTIGTGHSLERALLGGQPEVSTLIVLYNFKRQDMNGSSIVDDGGGDGSACTCAAVMDRCKALFDLTDFSDVASCTVRCFNEDGKEIKRSSGQSDSMPLKYNTLQPTLATVRVQSRDWQGNFEAQEMLAKLQSDEGAITLGFDYTADWARCFKITYVLAQPREVPLPVALSKGSAASGGTEMDAPSMSHRTYGTEMASHNSNASSDSAPFVWTRGSSSSITATATAAMGTPPSASSLLKVLVALPVASARVRDQQCRAAVAISRDHPAAIVGQHIQIVPDNAHNLHGTPNLYEAETWYVSSYLPHVEKHVICSRQHHNRTNYGNQNNQEVEADVVSLIGGDTQSSHFQGRIHYTFEPSRMHMVQREHVAPAHHHFRECQSCLDYLPKNQFAKFCFKVFRITGDSKTIDEERTYTIYFIEHKHAV